jgi:protease I
LDIVFIIRDMRATGRGRGVVYTPVGRSGSGMSEPAGAAPKRVALLIEDEFDDRQVAESVEALRTAGVEVVLVAPLTGRAYTGQRGAQVSADLAAGKARAKDFDAVVIPGGHAPDRMRMRHAMVDLVRDTIAAGKPVAAISHGPQLLISVNALRGRSVTCWPSIAIDVKNAGGLYMDKPVVEDGAIITARKSDDIPHFADAIVRALHRG